MGILNFFLRSKEQHLFDERKMAAKKKYFENPFDLDNCINYASLLFEPIAHKLEADLPVTKDDAKDMVNALDILECIEKVANDLQKEKIYAMTALASVVAGKMDAFNWLTSQVDKLKRKK